MIDETKESNSPRDDDGHGTHTSTMVVESVVTNAILFGFASGTAHWMAPQARLAVYKVCWIHGCMSSDILAGLDQVVADGVHVLSISLGGGSDVYYCNRTARGTFTAVQKGIFVFCSAGNLGLGLSTLSNVVPWITTERRTGPSTLLMLMESDHPVSKKRRFVKSEDSVMEEAPSNPEGVNQNLHWTQWQMLDSILPTGGFAHSYGLEAAMQCRMVNNQEDLRSFVIQIMENTSSLLLPFVHCASKSPDASTWVKLDQLLEVTLTNEVGRKASTSQGSALLRVAASVFTEIQALQDLRQTFLSSKSVSFHHAPIFGLICGLLGFDSEMAQRSYMFVTMRDVISAATRLNLIGSLAASVLQHRVAPDAERMVQKWRDRDAAEASQTAPLLDALQGCHAYMFSKLFCS